MASVGHVAVAVAAARRYQDGRTPGWRSMAFWSAVSLLPDVDVIGFSFRVPYEAPWGHRGATHSLTMAVAAGLAIGAAARAVGNSSRRTAVFAILVLISHGLLDTLTDGGLGVALLWPFDLTRYFAPWRPIPVAPIGAAFLSPRGLFVSFTELALFAPFLFYALRPARMAGTRSVVVVVTLWLTGVWLVVSGDPVRERVIATVLRADTAYTSGYSDAMFKRIAAGQSQQHVRDVLGPPFGESWAYPKPGERASATSAAALDGCQSVRLERGVVVTAFALEACRNLGIAAGTPRMQVARALGSPPESCWQYSWSPSGAHYRTRGICFVGTTVDSVIRGWR